MKVLGQGNHATVFEVNVDDETYALKMFHCGEEAHYLAEAATYQTITDMEFNDVWTPKCFGYGTSDFWYDGIIKQFSNVPFTEGISTYQVILLEYMQVWTINGLITLVEDGD